MHSVKSFVGGRKNRKDSLICHAVSTNSNGTPFRAAIAGMVLVIVLCGCHTITHNYKHYTKMGHQEAIQLISELGVSNQGVRVARGFIPAAPVTDTKENRAHASSLDPITSVDENGFEWASRKEGDANRRVNFNDVTGIKVDRRKGLFSWAPSTFDIILTQKGGPTWHIDFIRHPDKQDEYLSAFLTMCPNIK